MQRRRNPLGDMATGIIGGTLCGYFIVGAVVVLFTGLPLALGPPLPIEATLGSNMFLQITVRLVQSIYHVGAGCLAFFGFRFLQELLRGHCPKAAMKEAIQLPRLRI